MKKTIGIVLILLIGVYLTYRLVNKAPSSELTTNEQMVEIMNSGQCLACHNLNPDKPFYASWPIVGKIVMADIIKAQSEIDLTSAYNALINGEKVDVVSLNKIEKTIWMIICHRQNIIWHTGVVPSIEQKNRWY